MKRLILILALSLVPQLALAHTLKTDGNIGAVLHVDPNDEPVAGQPATLHFSFKAKSGQFKVEDCRCQLAINRNGQAIFNGPLVGSDQLGYSTFTFPASDVYQLTLSGNSLSGQFQAFNMTYDLRVEAASAQSSGTKRGWWIGAGAVAGVILIGLVVARRRPNPLPLPPTEPAAPKDDHQVY